MQSRSNWALICIIVVGILFGVFWYIQSTNIVVPPPISASPTQPSVTDTIVHLQAAALEIPIPSYYDTLFP